jgi:glutaconate CoA-transferase subunit A
MDPGGDKILPLSEALQRYVKDGAHISLGGFTLIRNPMAAVYELIRMRIKNLHVYAHSNGQGVDELVGAGCVKRLEIAYGGNGRFAPTCFRFRKAVERGEITVEDYSNYQMTLRFMAGAMGVPFLPTRSTLATDIVNRWGFSEEVRKSDPRIPDRKLAVMDNPFPGWTDADRVVLVPAIRTDVCILHAQAADRQGTTRIAGLTFADIEQAKASDHVIVTCEEIAEPEALRVDSDGNHLPFYLVDAVVPVPWGAYPTACYRRYDYDPVFFNEYRKAAAGDDTYRDYLESYVYGVPDHAGLLARVGESRLEAIEADPRTGYAVGLDRR